MKKIYCICDTVNYDCSKENLKRVGGFEAFIDDSNQEFEIIDIRNYDENIAKDAKCAVKGLVNSDDFLRKIIKLHNPAKNKLFHIFVIKGKELEFAITDCVLNQFPKIEERLDFALRASDWLIENHIIYDTKQEHYVSFLNHSGHFNIKNPTANESFLLEKAFTYKDKKYNWTARSGQLDTALSQRAREIKKVCSADKNSELVVVNDINEGNSIMKSFLLNGYKIAGYVIGANIPVVLNSRSNMFDNDYALSNLEFTACTNLAIWK